MNKLKQRNLVGKKFGKLTVIEMCGNNGKGTHYKSKVKCECGKIYKVNDTELINGRRTGCRSCNSYLKKHGKTNTKLFFSPGNAGVLQKISKNTQFLVGILKTFTK